MLLAVVGVTIISLTRLLWVHLCVGMALIGPVVLKLSSTGYRFARSYTASPRYRSKGPPPLPLRLIAPVVVITTVAVFASGVALLFAGPGSRGTLLPLHKVAFFVWIPFTALHVLAHLPPRLAGPAGRIRDFGRAAGPGRRPSRPPTCIVRGAVRRHRPGGTRHPSVQPLDGRPPTPALMAAAPA